MWTIQLLGGLAARRSQQEVTRFRTQKAASLLATLAFHAAPQPRELLVELLWPEAEPEAGRHNLSNALSFLRHALEPPGVPPGSVLLADRASVRLDPAAVTTDVAAFESALRQAAGEGLPEAGRLALFTEAAEQYRGPLLPGFYEEWIGPQALRLSSLFVDVVEQLVPRLLASGRLEAALRYAQRGVAADPLSEAATLLVMRVLAAMNQPSQALRAYRQLATRLREELDEAPSEGLQAYARELRAAPCAPAPLASAGTLAPPLLATKLAIPVPAPTLVPRPRLIARLPAAAAGRLALVVAPAGSGKSSLIRQWCEQHGAGRVAWLSLDAGDNEPVRFLRYLCAALATVAPDAAEPVSALLESPQAPSVDRAVTLLLNGLAALAEPATLVLDDYHQIEAQPVHQLVTFVIDHLPPTLFLILASRADPPLPLARLRLTGRMTEVRAAELGFTLEEASRFLNERMELALAPDGVARLLERTEGWIIALQLAALSLQGHPEPQAFLASFSGSHRHLVDYLVEEVLQRQPDRVQRFLRQTALLDRVCGPLCEAVTGISGGQAMLERVEAANLFLIPLDTERRWYRYHHLFAEALRARPQPPDAGPLAALHERAAAWFEAEGLIAEAMAHALAGAHWERAAGLIERDWERMLRYDEMKTLERWLAALPAELVRSRPQLSLALAVVRINDLRAAEAAKALDEGHFEPSREPADSPDFRGTLHSLRGFIARMQGNDAQAAIQWRQSLECLPPDNLTWRCPSLLELGVIYAERCDLEQAAAVLAEAIAAGVRGDYPGVVMRASHAYGAIRESQGALREAARIYEAALQHARDRRAAHAPVAALIFAGLGRLRYEWNDLSGALAYLEEARERTRSQLTGTEAPFAFDGAFELLRVLTALGDAVGGEALFEQLAAGAGGPAAALFEPAVAALRAQRAGTPAAEVADWLSTFEGRSPGQARLCLPIPGYCSPDLERFEIATWAQLRLAQGQAESVVSRLERFLETMVKQGRSGTAMVVRALLAARYWQSHHREAAVAVLEPALALAEREGYARVFLEAGAGLLPVLRACVAQGIAVECSSELLAAWEATSPVSEQCGAGPVAALRKPLPEPEPEVLRLPASSDAAIESGVERRKPA
jgi:LuxR family maltose regulon positive regulatory protein